ncbi:hypothetical protein AM500_22720 [Bacillus sp. FJAT-18017]|uniref:flagellar hook-basal body protein n=1 Tax=Bacillus sp. FJAT-18017 TaxID=1705566 RepID=UPI0006ADDA13|nr:flagellar hook-basal body protein [Bacillus sp. FJAT-18017]ALC92270.1 hypothetical protein AM500_22720 [Bacillus sp. FJAT-18017]
MNTSLYISSGALHAYQQKLDTSANNLANINTPGFKRREQSFSEILASQLNNQVRGDQEQGRLTPMGLRVGYGTVAGMTQLDMAQGQAIETGSPFDLMLAGKGFFQVRTGDGEVRYTRDGNFHLSPNPNNSGSYHLAHANGALLLDQTGNPIELSGADEVKITENGQIQLRNKQTGQTSLSQQQVGVVDIPNPSLLQNTGDNQFVIDEAALPQGSAVGDYVRAMEAGEFKVSTGFLEGSNVDITKEMADLMTSQRSYQMNSRAVSYADQMMGIANNIMR